jgi:hypothetical protein
VALAVLLAAGICGTTARAAEAPAWAVPTFESLGLYYNRAISGQPCRVRYRAGSGQWREGQPLVYDHREKQYRGSLVGLTPDTLYNIRLEAGGAPFEFQARTRSEKFPIGKATRLSGGTTDQTITIREGHRVRVYVTSDFELPAYPAESTPRH